MTIGAALTVMDDTIRLLDSEGWETAAEDMRRAREAVAALAGPDAHPPREAVPVRRTWLPDGVFS